MVDAGTVAEAEELDAAEPTDNVVLRWVTGKVALDEATALGSGVIVGASVEDDGLDITVGSTEGVDVGVIVGASVEDDGLDITVGSTERVDVGVAVDGTRLSVELGGIEDAVVGGRTEVDVLDVEGIPTGGELCITGALVAGGCTAGGAVEESGASAVSPGRVSPAKLLEVSV